MWLRPYQINIMFHGLFTFSGWPSKPEKIKIEVHHGTICITMIAKYPEDTTSVHSQLANSTSLSHTLSCLCSWQQQFLNFYKYLATHIIFSYIFITWQWSHDWHFYLRFGKGDLARSVKHKINLVWPKYYRIIFSNISIDILKSLLFTAIQMIVDHLVNFVPTWISFKTI